MKRILATTALALAMSTAAFSAAHMKPLETYQMEQKGDVYASNFIGMRVYATEKEDFAEWNAETMVDENAAKEWDDIGEVNDVILGRDGSVKAVILGIGGFIGIGEKDVAVPMSAIKVVAEKDDDDDFFLVLQSNKQFLTDAEPYKRTTKAEMKKEETAEAKEGEAKPMATEAAMERRKDADGREMLRQPGPVAREGYRDAKVEELTTETLTGARVYGSKDEDIGEVGKLIIDDSGKITKAVLDIGGFIGLGEHQIGVTMDELRIVRTEDGDDLRVYIDATEEELKAQPEYKDS